MEGPIGSKSAESAAIRDFYFSDGSLESASAALSPRQKEACIGIVMKVGRDAEGNWKDHCDYKLKDGKTPLEAIHDYVLVLNDAVVGFCPLSGSVSIGLSKSKSY